ncbi:hypothetical protein LCM20_01775 [Halobacillus litoralis]|nr:hypothetical protein [Halobacillus litoralis]MCA0969316.1 hypothetical protein [Halobacillus litoralis]
MGVIIVAVMILSLWSIVNHLTKMTNKIESKMDRQNELLEKINAKLEDK